MNRQGLFDEYESADIAVNALIDALQTATPFDRPGIVRALYEAIEARTALALEFLELQSAELELEAA